MYRLNWSNKMIHYTICNQHNEEIFRKQCEALEKNIPGLVKGTLLQDVDNSKIQVYDLNQAIICVHNSYYLDEVYVESDIDLLPLFE
jgi:hypothetical protein